MNVKRLHISADLSAYEIIYRRLQYPTGERIGLAGDAPIRMKFHQMLSAHSYKLHRNQTRASTWT
jgi:hypothetical protein